MDTVEFAHSPDYDALYPRGIPTSICITTKGGDEFDSGLVEYPGGHAKNDTVSLTNILKHKFIRLGSLALEKEDLI